MDDERFQNLVLEHLARITQDTTEIKSKLNLMDEKLDHTMEEVAQLREDVNGLKNEQFEIRRIK
jgi:tetrahydromethanopterin S-methyltransferase subunit G